MENQEKFLRSLTEDTSYDFIANNYQDFSKTELKDIILELLYGIHTSGMEIDIITDVASELSDRWLFNEED